MTLKEFLIMATGFTSIGLYEGEKLVSANDATVPELYLFEDCEVVSVKFGVFDDPKDKANKYVRACIYLNIQASNTED